MNTYEAVGCVVSLMAKSAVHEHWTVYDIERTVVAPWQLRQGILLMQDGSPVAWASWAFLTEEAEHGFRTGQRRLQPEDWNAGDRLFLMDVIAPYGHGREVLATLRRQMRDEGRAGQKFFFRRNKGGKRRYSEAVI